MSLEDQDLKHAPQRLAEEFFGAPAKELPDGPPLATMLASYLYQSEAQLPYSPSRRMMERCKEIQRRSKEANLPIRPLGFGPKLDKMRILKAPSCAMALMPLEKDPNFQAQDGYLAAPETAKRDLIRIRDAGLTEFDGYEIVHQLPDEDVATSNNIPDEWMLDPTVAQLQRRSVEYGRRTVALTDKLFGFLRFVGGSVTLGVAAVASLPLHVVALDPMLLSVIEDHDNPDGQAPICARFYLTHWLPEVKEV